MADLETTYVGLTLKNPVVMASSGLVSKVEGVKRAEAAGAGAVVLKSLFEEQIRMESAEEAASFAMWGHPEAQAYLQQEIWMRYGPREYCTFVEESKKAVAIPVIASINCVGRDWWTEYAKDLESSGADAIELNVLVPGTDPARESPEIEQISIDVVGQVAGCVAIPVCAKIGFSFASIANVTRRLVDAGAKSLVLFNRFHRPDIDIENLKLKHASPFSDPLEMHYALRWIGLLAGKLECDLAATTGIHEAEQAIKALLAGAKVVQVCSTVYKNGFPQITRIVEGIDRWMTSHDFEEIRDFQGRLSFEEAENPAVYERLQYIKHLVEIH